MRLAVAPVHLTVASVRGTVNDILYPAGFDMRKLISTWIHSAKFHVMAATLATACMAGLTPAAQAANPLELNFWLSGPRYEGRVANCEAALGYITAQFQEKESRFWNSALQITAYGPARETAFRPWQSDNIPRRYCSVEAMLNDGVARAVHYSIIEDGGLAGFSQGIEWCVVGLDRDWSYNPRCRSAKQ